MNLTREDTLRELELLPVWTLRTPFNAVIQKVPTVEIDPLLIKPEAEIAALPDKALPASNSLESVESSVPEWLAVPSEDNQFLFILEQGLSAEAEALLQNMLRAINVNPKTKMAGDLSTILSECTPKLLIAMGETTTQALVAATDSLEQLRGKWHQIKDLSANDLPLIVTYSPAHLLEQPAAKAAAWQDLCLAIATLEALPP